MTEVSCISWYRSLPSRVRSPTPVKTEKPPWALAMLFCLPLANAQPVDNVSPYNQLLNEDSLSDTSTSEETNLSTTSVRSQQVDNLDTSDEDLSGGGLLGELRGVGVDGVELGSLDGTTLVNGVTSDVHDATKSAVTNGNLDGGASVGGLGATNETLGTCGDPSALSI